MKIAITGARGTVGKLAVKACAAAGHHTVQVDRTHQEFDGTKKSEMRTADVANDYDATLKAFKGCDALIHLAAMPDPVDKADWKVHNNNVNSAFNGFHAAATLGIKRVCYASSVNAVGLAYANRPLHFDYFPLDEEAPQRPTDAYALAKEEAECQARSFVNWFPGMNIACLRIHEVAPLKDVQKEQSENWEKSAVQQLWGWVHPEAVARACLLSVEKAENLNGCQVLNIVAPSTTQERASQDLAKKHYPNAEIRGDMSGNQGFWTTDKAERLLGWKHEEKE
ncbi:Putative Nucleoside-diphosphate-sugar epimerases [Aspergillus calidoustus]|uniref:Putative Nucleoside-diphosphate-sugar epimerases n=1 Tax=Aspergillus calidoustus TaxID=454130 RepID=A0A0U5CAY6_ASPCI|nr:Putative Nucleoside-diphosphate-sugar epimerases [Aspergillus calidoustus]